MSAIANIVVYDGAPTPVSHTLLPISITRENGSVEAVWRENLASVPINGQVSITMKLTKLKSGVYRAFQRVSVPVMESVSGQNAAGYTASPKVAYVNTVDTVGFFHERSDTAGRRLVRQLSINVQGNISTSVAAATTGPLPELFDILVSPT